MLLGRLFSEGWDWDWERGDWAWGETAHKPGVRLNMFFDAPTLVLTVPRSTASRPRRSRLPPPPRTIPCHRLHSSFPEPWRCASATSLQAAALSWPMPSMPCQRSHQQYHSVFALSSGARPPGRCLLLRRVYPLLRPWPQAAPSLEASLDEQHHKRDKGHRPNVRLLNTAIHCKQDVTAIRWGQNNLTLVMGGPNRPSSFAAQASPTCSPASRP